MSITIKRMGTAVEVLQGAETLPEGQAVVLFTDAEHEQLRQQRLVDLDLQMPSFIRGDEDEDAAALFSL